jgi:triacylglycerol esterase/lipase EstA (alpha/beta hydrolase family)
MFPLMDRRAVGHVLQEVASTAQAVARYPFGLAEATLTTGRPSGGQGQDTPVLLVHGYAHNESGWWAFDRALRRAGHTSIHRMNYLPLGSGVPALAERLERRVEQIRSLTGAPRVHVVGHSLGGILLRWYAQELGGSARLATAITLATPHDGTQAAWLWPERTARQLRPGSSLLRRLAAGARPTDVRWVAVWSDADPLVWPHESARLAGAKNIGVRGIGHMSFLMSPRVIRLVTAELAEDGQARFSGDQASSSRFSPIPGNRTVTSAFSPSPARSMTTPSPHLPWTTSSPTLSPSDSAPVVLAGEARSALSTTRSR